MSATLVRELNTPSISCSAAGSTGSAAINLPGGNIAVDGNLIVALIKFDNARTFVSATDTAGSTYTSRGTFNGTSTSNRFQLLTAPIGATNTAGQGFSFVLSGNSGEDAGAHLGEYSGMNASQAAAELVGATGTDTALDSGALGTPSTADDLLVGMAAHLNRGWTVDANFTDKTSQGNSQHIGLAIGVNGEDRYTLTADSSTIFSIVCARLVGASGGASPPTITDVDEDNTISQTQANVEIDGTDFDTAVVELRQGGFVYTPSIDSQNATAIVFDMPALGGTGPVDAPHAGAVTLAVINGDDQEDTQAITVTDETDTETYLVGTPNADTDIRLVFSPDAESGDYVRISNVVGGDITDVNINSDLTWDADVSVTAFSAQLWDHDDGTWGDIGIQSTQDLTPDAFTFTDQTGVPLSDVRTSNTITVAGLDASAAVSITGGEYSKNGGAYTSSDGTAVNDDTFAVRVTSSASYSTALDVVLTIGTGSDTFTVTTQDEPPAITPGVGRKRDARRRGVIRLIGRG